MHTEHFKAATFVLPVVSYFSQATVATKLLIILGNPVLTLFSQLATALFLEVAAARDFLEADAFSVQANGRLMLSSPHDKSEWSVVSCSLNSVALSWEFLGFLEVPVVDTALFLELQAAVAYERTFCPAKLNLNTPAVIITTDNTDA